MTDMWTTETTGSFAILQPPKASDWKCQLFGTTHYVLRPPAGEEPNWFWRKMQYLAFGNKWVFDPPR